MNEIVNAIGMGLFISTFGVVATFFSRDRGLLPWKHIIAYAVGLSVGPIVLGSMFFGTKIGLPAAAITAVTTLLLLSIIRLIILSINRKTNA